jgi:hypothetical protein
VQILLAPLPETGSFVDEGFLFRGHINCSARVNVSGTNSNPECGAIREDQDINRARPLPLLKDVSYLLLEVQWTPSVPTANEKLTLAIRPVESESWRQIGAKSPIKVMVGPTDFADMKAKYQKDYRRTGGQIQLMMFPGQSVENGSMAAGTTIQQDFTIYATGWYRMEPPSGYTRLPR